MHGIGVLEPAAIFLSGPGGVNSEVVFCTFPANRSITYIFRILMAIFASGKQVEWLVLDFMQWRLSKGSG